MRPLLLVPAILCVATSPISSRADLLYTGQRNDVVLRLQENGGAEQARFASNVGSIRAMTVGPDGRAYVSSVGNFGHWSVQKFEIQSGQNLGEFVSGDLLYGIEFGPDGKFYGVDSWTNELVQYNGLSGVKERVVLSGSAYPFGISSSFSLGRNSDVFALTDQSREFARYDLASGQRIGSSTTLAQIGLGSYAYDGMTVTPTGDVLAAFSDHSRGSIGLGGVAKFTASGQYLQTVINGFPALGSATGGTVGLAFGPDGNLYVGSQQASSIFKYDPATWQLIDTISLAGRPTSATYIEFSPVPEPGIASCLMVLVAIAAGRRIR